MLKFTLSGETVLVDKATVIIDEFAQILKYGRKIKKPDFGNKMLLYIYFCCDMSEENFMKDLDYRQKPSQAKLRCFKDKDYKFNKEEQELIDKGIDAYNYFNETASDRAELTLDKKIDEARTKLEETEIEIVRNVNPTTSVITFASNENIISNIAKQIDDLMNLKLKIRQTGTKISNTGRVRADKGSTLIERGSFRNIVEDAT